MGRGFLPAAQGGDQRINDHKDHGAPRPGKEVDSAAPDVRQHPRHAEHAFHGEVEGLLLAQGPYLFKVGQAGGERAGMDGWMSFVLGPAETTKITMFQLRLELLFFTHFVRWAVHRML